MIVGLWVKAEVNVYDMISSLARLQDELRRSSDEARQRPTDADHDFPLLI
jgi:hypothetical protein